MIPSNRSEHPKYLPLFREPTVTFVDMAAAFNGVLAAPPIANVVAAKLNPCSIDLIGCMDFFKKKLLWHQLPLQQKDLRCMTEGKLDAYKEMF